MLLHPLWTTSILGLLAVSTGASGSEEHQSMKLVKRDPSGVPATVSHQNCATRYFKRLGSSHLDPVCNLGIQVGECFVNARIHNNVFATFEPQDGPMTASREGGPYGKPVSRLFCVRHAADCDSHQVSAALTASCQRRKMSSKS